MTRLLLGQDSENRTIDQLGLKLAEETGEVAREIKKIRKAKSDPPSETRDANLREIHRKNLIDELGDVLSAVAKIAELVKSSLIEVEAQALRKRGLL